MPPTTFTTALPGQSHCSRATSRRAYWSPATELRFASAMTAERSGVDNEPHARRPTVGARHTSDRAVTDASAFSDLRYSFESGHQVAAQYLSIWAISALMHCSKFVQQCGAFEPRFNVRCKAS